MNASGSGSMSAILQFGIGADHPPGLHLGGHPPSVGHSMSITHRSALTTLRDRSVPKCSDAEPGRDGRALTPVPARPGTASGGHAAGGYGRGCGRAAEALRAGQSLADAAITARLADQAHLTRWMREMVGLTPAAALPVLRDHFRRAT